MQACCGRHSLRNPNRFWTDDDAPDSNAGFLALSNVVLTRHIGSASNATRRAMAHCAADNVITALTGGVPPNCVNSDLQRC
jgi:gluconate 2-dehydrogenase